MADMVAVPRSGPREAALRHFREVFGGEVITPGDAGYDDGRRVWNAMFDRRPAIIVRPRDANAVAAAVRFARDQELRIAIRGGGHGAAGHGSVDDGVVIDLSLLRDVEVDPGARRARIGGGGLLSQLDVAAQAHGLVCPVGVVGHTGVGGLTLGGGNGRLQRRFGMTIDNLRSVDLVTADGTQVHVSERDHPELFWGIRGAGPNFGVVTSFEFELQPFDGRLTRGVAMYPGRDARSVWAAYRDFARSAPDELTLTFAIGRAVPEADFPPHVAGQPFAVVGFNHCGDPDGVDALVQPLFAGGEAFSHSGGPATYLEVQAMNDEAMGWGHRSFIRGGYADDLTGPIIDEIVELVADAPGDASFAVAALGGAIGRVAPDATAYPGRRPAFEISADNLWDDPSADGASIDWIDRVMTVAERDAAPGRYVNEMTAEGPEVTASVYADALPRLRELKRAWDPDNVFRVNHNIEPAA
jgi:FAD/FMN-containing dehydrogenase